MYNFAKVVDNKVIIIIMSWGFKLTKFSGESNQVLRRKLPRSEARVTMCSRESYKYNVLGWKLLPTVKDLT